MVKFLFRNRALWNEILKVEELLLMKLISILSIGLLHLHTRVSFKNSLSYVMANSKRPAAKKDRLRKHNSPVLVAIPNRHQCKPNAYSYNMTPELQTRAAHTIAPPPPNHITAFH